MNNSEKFLNYVIVAGGSALAIAHNALPFLIHLPIGVLIIARNLGESFLLNALSATYNGRIAISRLRCIKS